MDTKRLEIDVVMVDGTEHRVLTTLADRVQWDLTSSKKKWPPVERAASMWSGFLAWSAMCRTGLYSGPFEQFYGADCAGVDVVADDDQAETADPTGPAQPGD